MSRKVPSIGVGPAKTPRNAFDLSERSLYTQCAGMLTPVYIKELNPHDHVSLDIVSELQAQTIKGRAFVGMRQYMSAFFVPYSYLWTYWKSFITGLSPNNTVKSSGLLYKGDTGSSILAPTFKPLDVYRFLASGGSTVLGDDHGFSPLSGFVRLCDMLGYGNVSHYVYTGQDKFSKADYEVFTNYQANVLRWAAYQKIYQDHFLDDRFEKRAVDVYQLDKFTKDSLKGSSVVEISDSTLGMFMPRYAKYNKDYLNNFHQSPLFVSSVDSAIKTFVGTSPVTGSSLVKRGQSYNPYQQADTISSVMWNGSAQSETILSAAQIRNLFALDKMAQISGRAAKTYSAQMRAHYGVNVDGEEHVSYYCGGYSSSLDSQAVIATASGNGVDFGQQGSFVDNVSKGHINFDAKDFGVFMVLSWIAPEPRWAAIAPDPFNEKLTKEDYYHPEMADLGMQPLTSRRFRLVDNIKGATGISDKSVLDDDSVVGWTERYAEYKSSFDRLHGEFIPFKSLIFGADATAKNLPPASPLGSLSFLSTHMHSFTQSGSGTDLSWKAISVSPSCTDDLVDLKYNGLQSTDPFRIESEFRCTIVRDMSVSGLPRL